MIVEALVHTASSLRFCQHSCLIRYSATASPPSCSSFFIAILASSRLAVSLHIISHASSREHPSSWTSVLPQVSCHDHRACFSSWITFGKSNLCAQPRTWLDSRSSTCLFFHPDHLSARFLSPFSRSSQLHNSAIQFTIHFYLHTSFFGGSLCSIACSTLLTSLFISDSWYHGHSVLTLEEITPVTTRINKVSSLPPNLYPPYTAPTSVRGCYTPPLITRAVNLGQPELSTGEYHVPPSQVKLAAWTGC